MSGRLGLAEAALKAGRSAEAVEHLTAALAEDPARNVAVYKALVVQLYHQGRFQEGESWSAKAVERFPRDVELWNLRGVILRRLVRYPEALAALDAALKLDPRQESPLVNRGNVLLDMKEGAKAETVFLKLVRKHPRNAEFQRQLGKALWMQDKFEPGLVRLRQAAALLKTSADPWLDLTAMLSQLGRTREAEEAIDRALEAIPDHPKLSEAKAVILRRSGGSRRSEAFLQDLLTRQPDAAWAHHQLGHTIADYDRERANQHFQRAVELAPNDLNYLISLMEAFERTRSGDEGANIEEAYQLARKSLALHPQITDAGPLKALFEVLVRVCAFDETERLGSFASRGRIWAENYRHTALLKQLAHVKTLEDRYELLEQHRIWGRLAEKTAAATPIRPPAPRAPDGRIRLGFLSSDLRNHPVGYFALPLFEHIDPRFDVYCYSFYQGQEDRLQQFFTEKSKAYRWKPDINARDAASMIAEDQLDMLIELGGSTHMNKLDVMSYRAAPRQASWLGYPHSAGLSTIDYFVCDPHNVPPRRDLMVEQPLIMPKSWIALGRMVFSEGHVIEPGLPQDRAGCITFGTANNPHKYNPEMFAAWSRVLAAVPGSRFLFVRPEGGSATFCRNVQAQFAKNGIDPERIVFRAVRGAHMPHYNEIDVSLDTFPLTGGTTTTEALWMGVPVVSLIGEAFFERLSASILINAGVGDLATDDPARFTRIAVALAANRERRLELRQTLRERMRSGPLGQTEQFAHDFYELIARAVQEPARALAASR